MGLSDPGSKGGDSESTEIGGRTIGTGTSTGYKSASSRTFLNLTSAGERISDGTGRGLNYLRAAAGNGNGNGNGHAHANGNGYANGNGHANGHANGNGHASGNGHAVVAGNGHSNGNG